MYSEEEYKWLDFSKSYFLISGLEYVYIIGICRGGGGVCIFMYFIEVIFNGILFFRGKIFYVVNFYFIIKIEF